MMYKLSCIATLSLFLLVMIRDVISYLNMSIRESVPGPVRTIHTVRQTVARHTVLTVISPLSRHFCHSCFPPKIDLQPLVAIISTCAPGPAFTFTRDFVKPGELRNVVAAIIRRC